MINKEAITEIVKLSLSEDGAFEDITTDLVVDEGVSGTGNIFFRTSGVVCGIFCARAVFNFVDGNLKVKSYYKEGEYVEKDTVVARVKGSLNSILKAERTALNFISVLSGVATETFKFCREASKYGIEVYDTRKTHPGLRLLEKYAVRVGGGNNHRRSLKEAIFLKDNYYRSAGGFRKAIKKIRKVKNKKSKIPIIIEIEVIENIQKALKANPEVIICDNMELEEVKKVLKMVPEDIEVEVSGNVRKDNLEEIAGTGVKRISTSLITTGAGPLDVSLEVMLD